MPHTRITRDCPMTSSTSQAQSHSVFPKSLSPSELEALDLAYRQTLYQVFSEDKTISIRVGTRNPTLDQLVKHHYQEQWVLITAYNPYSQLQTPHANQVQNASLAKDLWPLHVPIFRAIGQDDARQWPAEESFFVIGIGLQEAIALGQKYDQNAILVGNVGHAPQLLWLRGPKSIVLSLH